jgi:hypothetical protein
MRSIAPFLLLTTPFLLTTTALGAANPPGDGGTSSNDDRVINPEPAPHLGSGVGPNYAKDNVAWKADFHPFAARASSTTGKCPICVCTCPQPIRNGAAGMAELGRVLLGVVMGVVVAVVWGVVSLV